MKRESSKTLALAFARPVSGGIKWRDIESLLANLDAKVSEREGSRIGVKLFGEIRVFHRQHPSPDADKGAMEAVRKWLFDNGVQP